MRLIGPSSRSAQAIATGARLHFMSLSGADPHGLNVNEAASIHVYTQETHCYRVLNAVVAVVVRAEVCQRQAREWRMA